MMKRPAHGFTLIELMVVISIIAILAAIGLVIYGSVQKNGRVSKRIQDLRALKTAAEQSKLDNGVYPSTQVAGANKWYVWASGSPACLTALSAGLGISTVGGAAPALAPKYIASLPNDPSDGCYGFISDGN